MKNKDQNTTPRKSSGSARRRAYRTAAIVSIAVLVLVVIGVNVLANILDGKFNLHVDMSEQKYYTLSETTKELLDGLDQDVEIYTLYETGSADSRVTELMRNYAAYSSRISYENVDVSLNPGFTAQFDPEGKGISASSLIVTNAQHSLYKVFTVYELYSIDPTGTYVYSFNAETRVSSAISYIETGVTYSVKLLSGHSERTESELSQMIISLNALSYEVETYDPSISTKELDPEYDLLMVVSPGEDLSDEEYSKLRAFLEAGGNAVFLMDYVIFDSSTGYTKIIVDELENFNSLLMMYGLSVNRDYIIGSDSSKLYKRVTGLVPELYGHSITNPLMEKNLTPVLMDCSSITIASGENVKAGILLETDASTYAKQVSTTMSAQYEDGDKTGPFTIAAVAQYGESKIALYGTSSFVLSNEDGVERTANNGLIVNTVNTLAGQNGGLDIAPKSMLAGSMQTKGIEPVLLIAVFSLIVLVIIAAGLVVWVRRKRR